MLFSSVTFLFYFLPLALLSYYIVPTKLKNVVLLAYSLIFYAWGGVLYFPLLIVSISINYVFGRLIHKYDQSEIAKKRILVISIIVNLLFLGVFKYSNFIVDNLNLLFNTTIFIPRIPLPIGISFYTFQAMSYVIDVYRRDGRVQKNILNLGLYISMFPQLVAGPIVRYQTVDDQITKRSHSFMQFNEGMERFVIGLFKKVIISNSVGELSASLYSVPLSDLSITAAWLGAIGYMLQIYFDFGGYSDMAIGLGKMLGFEFLENFNYPYIAKSVSDFWRRWHISLGSWFRDYIYIPLGGNRVSSVKVYRNLLVVWLVTGIWHGASWNYIAWGLYFGGFIMLERAGLLIVLTKLPQLIQHLYLLLIVLFGWVLFSQPNLTSALEYMAVMMGLGEQPMINSYTTFYLSEYSAFLILGIFASTPIVETIKASSTVIRKMMAMLKPLGLPLIYVLVVTYLINATFNPFIYFNF